jgi:hypothetical protein
LASDPRTQGSIRCYACSGLFGLSYDGDCPLAHHTLPYCKEFSELVTTDDAVQHSERCRKAAETS